MTGTFEQRYRYATPLLVLAGICTMPVAGVIAARVQTGVPWIIPMAAFVFAIGTAALGGLKRSGTIALVEGGVKWRVAKGPERFIARDEVLSGYEVPSRRAALLRLRGVRELVIGFEDRAAAGLLLEHLGQSVRDRTLTASLRGELGALTKGLLTFFGGGLLALVIFGHLLGVEHPALALWLCFFTTSAVTVGVVRRFGFPKVVVGLDGVRVVGGFRTRFVPYSKLGPIYKQAQGLQLALEAGELLNLELVGQSSDEIEALARRIEEGREASATERGPNLGALGLAGRSIHTWKADLRRIAVAPGGFRDYALSRDDFERLLVDARAPVDQRIGAALALRATDPAAAARIRVAAETCANENLRIALDACASDTEDVADPVLAAALKSLT